MRYINLIAPLAGVLLLAPVALAAPNTRPAVLRQDAVSARDQAAYAREDIAARFGVAFRPHAAVCDAALAGYAHCDARIVVDGTGRPVAPDRGSTNRGGGSRGGRGGGGGGTPPPPPAGAYGPAQFRGAYGLTGSAPGAPIIGIVDAYDNPTIQSDLGAYSAAYGIPALPACSGAIAASSVPCLQKINQHGSTSSLPSANAGWALEIALDVEAAHAACANCRILLVEANSNSYSDLMAAVDEARAAGASVISNSYGSGEFAGEGSYDSHFNHPGTAYIFSAGDGGYGVEYPAASPYVTAVGGTSLYLNSDGSYNTELAWAGTGSGCSSYESKPAWQADPGCANRTVADVSADADPNTGAAVYDTYGYYGIKGWFTVGGTSLAAPLIAATYALSGNVPPAAAESALPYAASATSLHDVAGGSNGSCGGSYLCTALAGFDGPTGLGTPRGTGAF